MSTELLAGKKLKEWSLIILMVSLAMTFVIVGVGFALAIMYNPGQITFTGSFDLSQFTGILIGIAIVAVTLVAQQLTAKQQAEIAEQIDKSWIESDPDLRKPKED